MRATRGTPTLTGLDGQRQASVGMGKQKLIQNSRFKIPDATSGDEQSPKPFFELDGLACLIVAILDDDRSSQ